MYKNLIVKAIKPIIVLLLALVALLPLLQPTLPWSADGQLHFWRVVELDHCLRNGYFYPRWMPDMAYGYGYPLLNYYAPLSVYLAEGLHLLGLDFTAALLAAFCASLALGALGAYFWAREAFGEAGGLLAAIAYTYAPYTLYDAIWRGNLAESLALGVLPWVFWRLRRLALCGRPRDVALTALAFAVLVLSHNISALIASPLLVAYALLLWRTHDRSRQALGRLAGALALGLILSAFFWLPAFMEREFVQTTRMVTTSHFDYRNNFITPGELLSPPEPADVTLMNPPVPRSLGWPALILALLGATAWPTKKSKRWEIWGATAALLLCALLTLSLSRPLWEALPLLPYVGFPWRFLGPAGLMAAWLAAASLRWLDKWRPGAQALALGLTALANVVFALTWLYPRYLGPIENPTPAGLIAFEQSQGAIGTTSVGEYLPAWVQELPDTTVLEAQYQAGGAIRRLSDASLPSGASIVSETWRLLGGEVTVRSPQPWTATLHLFYFPGWRVWLDGQAVKTTPSAPHGLLRFAVPAGERQIRVRFGPTPWRLAGAVLPAAGWIALAAVALRRASPRPAAAPHNNRLAWAAALLAVGLVWAVKTIYLDDHDSPLRYAGFDGQQVVGVGAPAQVRFDSGLRLLGHDPAAMTVESGGALSVRLYWTADAPPDEEYSSFLHLIDAEGHRWGQSDNQHPGGYPTVRWRPGEYNRDVHTLRLLPGTPPGSYTLRAGLVGRVSGQGLDVLDERGAPAGTSVAIGRVTVARAVQPPSIEALNTAHRLEIAFDDLTLLEASLDRPQAAPGETLLLKLYWRADRALAENYTALLLLSNEDEQPQTANLLPVNGGSYPINPWHDREVILRQHWLTLPADLDSGVYSLRLQLLKLDSRALVAVSEPVHLGKAGRIVVVAPMRQTAIPPMQHRLDINLADRVTLLGYDLEPEVARPGETLRLTLYWRAEQPMSRSYAVFSHLLNAEERIVAQHDGLPANWTRPTTGWLPGQVVTDVHEWVIEAGTPPGLGYLPEVGLYDPETNIRLPVLDASGQIVGDRVLLTPVSLVGP